MKAGIPLRTAGRRSITQIRHLAVVRSSAATGSVKAVYAQSERDFGMIAPPVSLHSASPELLAATWILLREVLVADGVTSRAGREAVAAAVSAGNDCPYCVTVHRATLAALTPEGGGEFGRLEAWARASATAAGAAGHPAPFGGTAFPEYAGTAVAFQYINRMATLYLSESPLPPSVPGVARPGVLRMLGKMMGTAAGADLTPGESLALLADAPLPADLAWTASRPVVASAFARAAAAYEAAGARSVPLPVRELVTAVTGQWDGTPPEPSRAWALDLVSDMDGRHRPAAMVALLTALAPHQIADDLVDACRTAAGGDRALLELTSWAAFTAARRVGSWLVPAGRSPGGRAGDEPSPSPAVPQGSLPRGSGAA